MQIKKNFGRYAWPFSVAFLMSACGDAKFQSSTKQTTSDHSPENPASNPSSILPPGPSADAKAKVVPPPAADAGENTGCNQYGQTQAKLLTDLVQNGTAGNFVEYQLTLTDCSGKQVPFSANTVSFDLAAYVSSEANLSYVITDASDKNHTVSGTLNNLKGHDLFGNNGSNYYHYETDKPVSFAAGANAIIVHIDLNGMAMRTYGNQSSTDLNTYLAFGDAAPVKAVVKLSGLAPASFDSILGTLVNPH